MSYFQSIVDSKKHVDAYEYFRFLFAEGDVDHDQIVEFLDSDSEHRGCLLSAMADTDYQVGAGEVMDRLLYLVEHGDYNLSRSAAMAMDVCSTGTLMLKHLLYSENIKYKKEIEVLLSLLPS